MDFNGFAEDPATEDPEILTLHTCRPIPASIAFIAKYNVIQGDEHQLANVVMLFIDRVVFDFSFPPWMSCFPTGSLIHAADLEPCTPHAVSEHEMLTGVVIPIHVIPIHAVRPGFS